MMADDAHEIELAKLATRDGIRGRNKKTNADGLADLEAGGDAAASSDNEDDNEQRDLSSVQAVLKWWGSLRTHFGDGLLLQIFFVYFTQGIRSTLCSLGTSYFLNETLQLPPAQSEALRGTAAIPWIIKPLYGMLSDSVPIWGTRRKSYLLIFSAVSAAAYFALSVPGFITTYVSMPPPSYYRDNALTITMTADTSARRSRSWSRVSASRSVTS